MFAFVQRIGNREQGNGQILYERWDRTPENGTVQPTAERRGETR